MNNARFLARFASILALAIFLAGGPMGCASNHGLRTTNHQTSGGSVADGNTPPEGKDGAAVCDPNISGPHQWPLNVATGSDFYPDPSATPSVSVTTPPNSSSRNARTVTITVQGSTQPYPGQSHP